MNRPTQKPVHKLHLRREVIMLDLLINHLLGTLKMLPYMIIEVTPAPARSCNQYGITLLSGGF